MDDQPELRNSTAPTVSPAPGDAALADAADPPADVELPPAPEPVVVVADAADAIPTAEVPMAVVVDVVGGAADAAAAPVDEVPPAPTPEGGECAICLAELDSGGEARTLVCGHAFHAACINEWLSKDGRCPVCRHVCDEAAAARQAAAAQRGGAGGGGVAGGVLGSAAADANLLQESRRLMMFATMEARRDASRTPLLHAQPHSSLTPRFSSSSFLLQAALSVLVMSYIADLLSPALMLLAACITFYGASQFSPKAVAICRPILGLNVVYHLYLVARLVHQHEGTPFFSEEYTGPRAILISLGCVVMMELIALKKARAAPNHTLPPRHTCRPACRAPPHTLRAHRLAPRPNPRAGRLLLREAADPPHRRARPHADAPPRAGDALPPPPPPPPHPPPPPLTGCSAARRSAGCSASSSSRCSC